MTTANIYIPGQQVGKLTIIGFYGNIGKYNNRAYTCKCFCGNECIVLSTRLKNLNTQSCGCSSTRLIKIPNNTKFGEITVLEFKGVDRTKSRYLCKCHCGKEFITTGSFLKNGNVKSCGCLRKKKFGESSKNGLYNSYKRYANKRNLVFDLEKEYFLELTSKKCAYCNKEPSQIFKGSECHGCYVYNGIDRIKNEIGYTKENCVSCCKFCNIAKRDRELIEYTTWILNSFNNLRNKGMIMELKDYQEISKTTAIYPNSISVEDDNTVRLTNNLTENKNFSIIGLLYCSLGLVGESGEFCNKLKKIIRDNNGEISKEKLKDFSAELGDILWYVANCCTELGLSLNNVAKENLDKLKSRQERNQLKGDGDNR